MRIRIVAIGMLLLLSAALTAAVQSGNDLYQQGLARETAGDIKGAIQIFERIVRDFSSNRALTARALLQLGRWSELLGQDQAPKYYERLVREFANQPGQTELVAQAQSRLATLAPSTPAAMPVLPLPDVTMNGERELVAVSPDGTKAIVIDYSNGQNIALYDFSRKQTRLLTDLNWLMGYTSFAVWSPDSRRVAYMQVTPRYDASELRVMMLDGRSSVVYRTERVGDLQPVGWTPDGATLVVVIGRPDKTWSVGTLPATGGRFTPLRSFGWSYDYHDASPRLSPDGRFIAYLEGEKGQRDVHVVSLDGRDAYRITDDPADDFAPIWSPDGRHLAFTSNRLGAVSLWTVELKDGKAGGPPVKLKDGMQSARLIDWAKRGIFYGQSSNTSDLYTVAVDPVDGRATGAPRPIPYSRTGRNVNPVWSADGERLAFVSSAASEPNRRYVVVMRDDGSQTREFLIPTTSRIFSDLRWFGNGLGLGLSGTDARGAAVVFRLQLKTGEWDTIPLSGEQLLTRVEWNRDGSTLYLARWRSGNPGIFERAVTGDSEELVYSPSLGLIGLPSLEFSPDRKSLAFEQRVAEANYMGRNRILVLDVETRKTRTVLEETINLADPWPLSLLGWTHSGDLMVERLKTGGSASETLLVPVNGGSPRSFQLPTFTPSGTSEREPRFAKWSPDGRSMVLVRVNRNFETFVIENPLAAARPTTVSR